MRRAWLASRPPCCEIEKVCAKTVDKSVDDCSCHNTGALLVAVATPLSLAEYNTAVLVWQTNKIESENGAK